MGIYNEDGEQINNLYQYLQKTENGYHTTEYIKEKFHWTDEHIQTAHWEAPETALNATPEFKRSKGNTNSLQLAKRGSAKRKK